MINRVLLCKKAMRDLAQLPPHVARKFKYWIELVEFSGLEIVRRVPGYHDEPLKGSRANQRSIRLNLYYRAIYTIEIRLGIETVVIQEVTKHVY